LGRLGQFDRAGPLRQRAVDMLQQTAPKKATAAHPNKLVLLRLQRKEYDAAQGLLERARVIVDMLAASSGKGRPRLMRKGRTAFAPRRRRIR